MAGKNEAKFDRFFRLILPMFDQDLVKFDKKFCLPKNAKMFFFILELSLKYRLTTQHN